MQIIEIVPSITQEASGPTYVMLRLCDSLIDHGQQVTLATLDWEWMPLPPLYLKTFQLGWGPRRLGISPAMRLWLNAKVFSKDVDILHNHGMWQMNSLYPGWAASKGKLNLVVSPHGAFTKWAMQNGSNLKKFFWPVLQRPALDYATCFHATAVSEYEDIRRLGFTQPVAIIPIGIDIPILPPKQSNDIRTLLFLSRIHHKKGLDMLIPAWRAVQSRFPDWQLVIAGSDVGHYGKSGYLEELHLLIQSLGAERIKFVGPLYGTAKMQTYRDSDLYILPTYSENFGITVTEALAAGTPAIVTKGAPWEGLETNEAGWWIDIGIDPLVACLEDAMSRSPDQLKQMGQHGRSWMESEFAWPQIGAQMAATYQWLLNKSLPVPAWVRVD
ncbi:MAG: glycosyltransferase [Methylococcaceae bacterium]